MPSNAKLPNTRWQVVAGGCVCALTLVAFWIQYRGAYPGATGLGATDEADWGGLAFESEDPRFLFPRQNPSQQSEGLAAAANENGVYGYVDGSNHWVIPPKYLLANRFSDGLAVVTIDSGEDVHFGVIDRTGQFVVPPIYSSITDFQAGTAVASLKPEWAYVNRRGETMLTDEFSDARRFYNGVAAVCGPTGKWGFLRSDGKYLREPQFTWAADFIDGIAAVGCENGEWGYIGRNGAWLLPCGHDLNCEGSPVFSPIDFQSYLLSDEYESSATTDACAVENFLSRRPNAMRLLSKVIPFLRRRAKSLITLLGRHSRKELDHKYPIKQAPMNGLLVVGDGERFGTIDDLGHELIPMRLGGIGRFSEGMVSFYVAIEPGSCRPPIGFMDRQGRTLISPRYASAGHFEGGLAPVCVDDRFLPESCDHLTNSYRCGFIDRLGHEVIPPNLTRPGSLMFDNMEFDTFGDLGYFHRGMAPACRGAAGDCGYIDMGGAWVIAPQFRHAREFSDEDLAPVMLPDRYMLLDREGHVIDQGNHLRSRTMP